VIPKEIQADVTLIEAMISEWRLEVMSTNWSGYWIIQLARKGAQPLALLVHLDQLAAICTGLRMCIDAAKNPSLHPGATTMHRLVAVDLPTQIGNEGAITITSGWDSTPVVMLRYHRDKRSSGDQVIRQGLHADDAMDLYDLIVGVYNKFPMKQSWKARALT